MNDIGLKDSSELYEMVRGRKEEGIGGFNVKPDLKTGETNARPWMLALYQNRSAHSCKTNSLLQHVDNPASS